MNNNDVVVGSRKYPVRFSYANVWEPKKSGDDDTAKAKYSVSLLIQKADKESVEKIRAAVKSAAEAFRAKHGNASLPANPLSPLHDGDGEKPNGGDYGPECRGCWVMNASSDRQPVIVDNGKNEILDKTEFYSGCYGRACVNFYGYSNKRKGVGCGLKSLQKFSDGEPFGVAGGSASDFPDDAEDGADDWMQ